MDELRLSSPEYGNTVWPSMGMLRGFADWDARWKAIPKIEFTHIVDGGGGAGAFAPVCKAVWPDSRITILEPSPDMLPYLHKNVDNLDSIEVLPFAASSDEHTAMLGDDIPGRQKLNGETGGVLVECYRLDDLIDYSVQLLKIDVEGHELECIRGATRILENDRPYLVVEVKAILRETERDPRPLLEKMGYVCKLQIGQDFFYGGSL